MKTINVRGVILGEGRTKIICPVVDAALDAALATVERAKRLQVDAIEYRADWSENVCNTDKLMHDLRRVRECLGERPLMFTFRSVPEGGHTELPRDEYIALVRAAIDSGCADMVDIEHCVGDDAAAGLIAHAREKGVVSLYSYHNFNETPEVDRICDFIAHARALGADVPKCAVMARGRGDLVKLLSATERMTRDENDTPVLTVAMGVDGVLSRLAGEVFGSCMTFCTVNASSAPGQVDCERAYAAISALHDCITE